ncbi:hypothetical protein DL95DRAFT_378036 [Leptodontidium sp. 2 PMI_412]|nr:hypothetical protein BKA61DRAFT_695131 [Leptodontidium sp. MPI-SDFR-AT-0119]KAH9224431.1 hypothetical protein DL95DRAFT_378036 [Leptodontidium sp. 2 PMI_412]
MPADEYAPVVRGALKLKGSAPSGIKKKKKKPKTSESEASSSTKKSALQSALEEEDAESSKAVVKGKGNAKGEDGVEEELDEVALRELEERGGDGKTASERAYEEMRRKRLHDRLQKEGVKTHKQRVEELNKYLSNLSEHHDMPRIGPG